MMLPKGWARAPLGECARFLSGNTPSKENADYWGGEFPWVTAKDMKKIFLSESGLGLTAKGRSVAAVAPTDSILVLTRGMTLLKNLPVSIATQEMAFNQDVKALVANGDIDPRFLAYQLISNKSEILDLVDTAGHGTGRLDTELLKQYEIVVPPKEEQRQIVKILSTWNSALSVTQTLLENNKTLKRGALQKIFSNPKKQGQLLKGFTDLRLEDLVDINPEREKKPADGKVSFIPMEAVSEDAYVVRKFERDYDAVSKGYVSFRDDDILVAKITPCFENGKGALVSGLRNGIGFGSTEFHVLRPKEGFCGELISHIVASREFRERGATEMIGSAGQKRVSSEFIRSFRVGVPSEFRDQVALSIALTNFDKLTRRLQQMLDALHLEQTAVARLLLTGKRRVQLQTTQEVASA